LRAISNCRENDTEGLVAKFNFEESMDSLETIVKGLETGELSLDESIKNFEQGAKIYKDCKKYLGEVEKKVQVLTDSLEESSLDD